MMLSASSRTNLVKQKLCANLLNNAVSPKNDGWYFVLFLRSSCRISSSNYHAVRTLSLPFRSSSGGATVRLFSSRDSKRGKGAFQLDALPFTISPEEALEKFRTWASKEQGLDYLLQQSSIRIGAAYCPVWSFNLNIRFVTTETKNGQKRRSFTWKPVAFQDAYGANQTVIHVPGLSVYAGYTYRRSLVNPVHSSTLVFMADQTVPFGQWMLRDMKLAHDDNQRLEIFPDPWNATKGRAYQILRDDLQLVASAEADHPVKVQTEIVSSRRVYMPTYSIDYKVLGIEYQAFVSGCDQGAAVSGESHTVINADTKGAFEASQNFMSQAASAAQSSLRILGGRGLFVLFQFLTSLFGRFLVRIPLIGLLAGTFIGFRKIVQPFFNRRAATAEWERQREHEAAMEDQWDHEDDFADNSGAALRYFQQNKDRILRNLSGEAERDKGDYNWYTQWEQWAQRQWEQQKQQQQWQQGADRQQSQQQTQQRTARPAKKVDFKWDFDPNDPYSVLGISRNATTREISAAYRKQMLKYHPDTQGPNATEAEKLRAEERSKLINEAYKVLRK